ncbi:MAG: hypothetical protein JWO38_4208 [Gemmataceae bacterium]|nr:hypothetical protein [Gemmataceae bacterium]
MPVVIDLLDDVVRAEDNVAGPDKMPDHFEVLNGTVVEVAAMSDYAGSVANRLNRAVDRYLDQHDSGESGIERLYHIPQPEDPGRNRRPDWSFVSFQRWPKDRPYSYRGNARDVVPDLVAEVVSPGDSADDLIAKAREYLRGGVRLVWIVYPLAQEIHAYMPNAGQIRVYFAADELDAPDILPGFHTPVSSLFPPIEPPTAASQPDPAA